MIPSGSSRREAANQQPRSLRITDQAEDDLSEVWAFIAADNPEAASAFVHKLRERFGSLLFQPELGPGRDHLVPGLRAHFFRDYAFYYRYTDTEVIIVRVLHGARDASALMASEED